MLKAHSYQSCLLFILCCICVVLGRAQFSGDRHQYVEYIVMVDHPDRIYDLGENASVTVYAHKGGIPLDGVTLRYSVGDEMMLPEPNDSTMFHNGIATIDMGTSDKPLFRECDLTFDVFDKTYKDVVKVAYAPELIRPFTQMPKDFKEFWSEELGKAQAVDLNPQLTHMKKYSNDKIDVFLVRLTVGDGKEFYGYLSKPKDDKKHPVMFKPPGAGPYKRWVDSYFAYHGFIVLNVDIHGLNPECSDEFFHDVFSDVFGYWKRGMESRDNAYFRQVYAGCSRCIDYLCSLPEWDGETVVTMDGSQGGALSIISAALNPKVSYVCAFYPALCDLEGFAYGRAGGWPKYFRDDDLDPTNRDILSTLPYYDVVNFARILEAPGYYSFGFNDDTCSPTSIYGMLNEMKAPKTIYTTFTNAHYNFPENEALARQWVLEQCGLSDE